MQPDYVGMPHNLHYGYLSFDLDAKPKRKLTYIIKNNHKPSTKSNRDDNHLCHHI